MKHFPSPFSRRPPAIDQVRRTGHLRRSVAGQEDRRPLDVLHLAAPTQLDFLFDPLAPLGVPSVASVRGVRMKVGQIVLTRMPIAPTSMAIALVITHPYTCGPHQCRLCSRRRSETGAANYLETLSHLQRVVSPLSASQENFQARELHATHLGRLCPVETPEGTNIGLRKNLALLCSISSESNEDEVLKILKNQGLKVVK